MPTQKALTKREKEEKYFHEEETRKRKALRDKLDQRKAEIKASAKHPHFMKCPKCGQDLEEIAFADVMIDKCKGCKGIYLDAGELELLMEGQKAKGFLSRFLSSVKD